MTARENFLIDDELTAEFPDILVCTRSVWPDCGEYYRMPDGRLAFICPYQNEEFLAKQSDWQKIEERKEA